ncbi:MAG: twin-arginine translocase subunit TatC [Planctomycetota bacterium]
MTADGDGDRAMPLGDHLDELRARMIRVLLLMVVMVVVCLVFQAQIKDLVELPLRRALTMVDPLTLRRVGLALEPGEALLKLMSLIEAPIQAFKLALLFAFAGAFPYLLYQLWSFIAPGLHRPERRVAFLMLPAAVLFFYAGAALGYRYGLPYLFKFLIEFNAIERAELELRQSYYHSLFTMMTLAFGLVMDLPWLILVLVKAKVMTPAQIAARRRMLLLIGILLAAVFTPPDPFSQLMLFGIMIVMFESGLLAARLVYRRDQRSMADQEADDAA